MVRRVFLPLFLLILVFGGVVVVHAQLGSTDPIQIVINPDYPQPYQIITVTPQSTVIDLSASTISVSVNGKVVEKGTGAEGVNVAVGAPGVATNITVTAINNGQTYTKSITIRPAAVALILEPQSISHPFYEGGSLVGSEGGLRLIALPDLRTSGGTPIPAANLVYTWKNGDQILEGSSGIGKSVLTAVAPVRYRDTTISLTVASQDNSVVAQTQALISPVDPTVRIYENDPLLGPRFDTALPSSMTLTDSEETFRAVPYNFSSIPSFAWSVNGTPSQTGQDITVRPTGSGKGTAQLGVTVQSNNPLQQAVSTLAVTFGSAPSGIFNF